MRHPTAFVYLTCFSQGVLICVSSSFFHAQISSGLFPVPCRFFPFGTSSCVFHFLRWLRTSSLEFESFFVQLIHLWFWPVSFTSFADYARLKFSPTSFSSAIAYMRMRFRLVSLNLLEDCLILGLLWLFPVSGHLHSSVLSFCFIYLACSLCSPLLTILTRWTFLYRLPTWLSLSSIMQHFFLLIVPLCEFYSQFRLSISVPDACIAQVIA